MALFVVKERTKRNRIRIDTQIIRIENALINTLLNRLSNNLKQIRSIKFLFKDRESSLRRDIEKEIFGKGASK